MASLGPIFNLDDAYFNISTVFNPDGLYLETYLTVCFVTSASKIQESVFCVLSATLLLNYFP